MQHAHTSVTAHDSMLLTWCVVASIATHVMLVTVLPGWRAAKEDTPKPLTVEIIRPPEIELPKPLPLAPEPPPRIKPKPEPVKPVDTKRIEQPPPERQSERPPERTLTAKAEAPVSPAAPVIPVSPPAQESKPAPAPSPPPVAAPAPPAPQPVTPPRSDAAYLNNPRPNYPLAAKRRGDQGTVLLRVMVSADGHAANVGLEKSSGFPSLDEAALSAVKSWRFVPAKQGTQTVEAPVVVPLVFKLD